jgi:hypothetical protein
MITINLKLRLIVSNIDCKLIKKLERIPILYFLLVIFSQWKLLHYFDLIRFLLLHTGNAV